MVYNWSWLTAWHLTFQTSISLQLIISRIDAHPLNIRLRDKQKLKEYLVYCILVIFQDYDNLEKYFDFILLQLILMKKFEL